MTDTMKRYRLMNGFHSEPRRGFKGQMHDPERLEHFDAKNAAVVESDRPLDKIFPNKFRLVTKQEEQPPVNIEVRRPLVDHMIASGHWVDDDRDFLETLPDDNFKRLQDRFNQAITAKAQEGKIISNLGDDVTSQFQAAWDAGFLVFKNAKNKYQVTRKQEPNKPINKEALNDDQVDSFVVKFLKEK